MSTTIDTRSLLGPSTHTDTSTGGEEQPKSTVTLTKRSRRLLLGGVAVLASLVLLALILDYAFFLHESGGGVNCGALPAFPPFDNLTFNSLLPDPFVNAEGTRITTKEEWQCSRQLISANMQHWELGTRPPPPAYVTSSILPNDSGMLIVAGHDSTNVINFTVSIRLPSGGTAPYPAMLGAGQVSLNQSQLLSLGVAILAFDTSAIAQQNGALSRGIGKFYDLYGSNHSAGALIAWSWAASLIMDQLAGSGQQLIDASSVGVTGCSRWGKGALVIGAFDERFALTIPQESGSGGIANWRISDWQGPTTQTLGEITGENVWYTATLSQFNQAATKLPFDHHSLIGLVAPRGLLTIDNPSFEWLGNISSWGGALAGRLVYTALGVEDRMGITQLGGHGHCQLPYAQNGDVERYVQRFLLHQQDVNTTLVYKDRDYPEFSLSDWVNWTVPILS